MSIWGCSDFACSVFPSRLPIFNICLFFHSGQVRQLIVRAMADHHSACTYMPSTKFNLLIAQIRNRNRTFYADTDSYVQSVNSDTNPTYSRAPLYLNKGSRIISDSTIFRIIRGSYFGDQTSKQIQYMQ